MAASLRLEIYRCEVSSSFALIAVSFSAASGYFSHIISATQVKEGKPSPDIYLYACEQLGLTPGECLAVEDAPNGIMAAYRAGLSVVMVPDQTQPDEELEQYLYACVGRLDDIKELLA